MGMLYKRGELFWIKYYSGGKPIRESTGTSKQKEAERFLKDREGRVAISAPVLPRLERIRFTEIADALIEHYHVTGDRQLRDMQVKLKPVRAYFNDHRLVAINQKSLTTYISNRQAADRTNATINRELALLGKALRLAEECGQMLRVPPIHLLQESAPRSGFFERTDFERVRKHLATRPDLQLAISLANAFGWRMQSEALRMELSQVDLDAGTLRLEPGTTKNGEARTVYILPELVPLLEDQILRVKALSRKLNRVIPFLFPNPRKGRFQGCRLLDFRKAWSTACQKAGLVGTIRHDLRRTAVRNLVRSGVSETVAMKITGHKTRSVFDHYNITSDADLREAAKKLHGHNLGTVPALPASPTAISS